MTLTEICLTIASALYLLYRGGRFIEAIKRFFVNRLIDGAAEKSEEKEKEVNDATKKANDAASDYHDAKRKYDSEN